MLNLLVRNVTTGTKRVNYRVYFFTDNVDLFLDAVNFRPET